MFKINGIDKEFLYYWREHETQVTNAVGYYIFNSPSKDAFSSGLYHWPSRPDMLSVFTVLQAYNLFGLAFGKEDWTLIERAIKHTLAFQHPHGHWDNPCAVNIPFCAETLAAVEALIEYRKARKCDRMEITELKLHLKQQGDVLTIKARDLVKNS